MAVYIANNAYFDIIFKWNQINRVLPVTQNWQLQLVNTNSGKNQKTIHLQLERGAKFDIKFAIQSEVSDEMALAKPRLNFR